MHRVVLARRPEGGGAFVDMVPDSQPAPADGTLVLRHALFRLTQQIAQVSESTYHYFPDLKPPAAANTLPVLAGLGLDGVAGLHGPSDPIPIGTLVDATNFRPLPFAHRTPVYVGHIKDIGQSWVALAGVADGVDDHALVAGVVDILGGAGEFAGLRAASGLKPGGYGPVALDAVVNRRSAPPVLSALSEGFTLDAPGIGFAEPPVRVGAVEGVPLDAPRLRSIMQRPVLTAATATAPTTSVRVLRRPLPAPVPAGVPGPVATTAAHLPVTAVAALRDRVPGTAGAPPVIDVRTELVTAWETPGMALLRRPAGDAPQPTRAARSARSLRHPALGGPTGRAASTARWDSSASCSTPRSTPMSRARAGAAFIALHTSWRCRSGWATACWWPAG